jgi:hypothetical protein
MDRVNAMYIFYVSSFVQQNFGKFGSDKEVTQSGVSISAHSIQFILKFHLSNLGHNMLDGYRASHIQCNRGKQCDK